METFRSFTILLRSSRLAGVDLLASHAACLGYGETSRKAEIPEAFPELTTGMVVFRKSAPISNFFDLWLQVYDCLFKKKGVAEDQPSFRRALFESRMVRFAVLPPEMHYLPANFMRIVGPKVYAVHNHSFEHAQKVAEAFNTRIIGDYSGWVDGLDVFRNPYVMTSKELREFSIRSLRLIVRLWLLSAKRLVIKTPRK